MTEKEAFVKYVFYKNELHLFMTNVEQRTPTASICRIHLEPEYITSRTMPGKEAVEMYEEKE
jgi:hypothetical protein